MKEIYSYFFENIYDRMEGILSLELRSNDILAEEV